MDDLYANVLCSFVIVRHKLMRRPLQLQKSMEEIFQAKQNRFTKPILVIWSTIILSFYVYVVIKGKVDSFMNNLFGALVILSIIGTAIYFWKNNYYKINGTELIIIFGLRKWKIAVQDINFIRLNQKPTGASGYFWNGGGASLSLTGIVIYYKNKYSIYISPVTEDKFIGKLKEMNERIEIREGFRV